MRAHSLWAEWALDGLSWAVASTREVPKRLETGPPSPRFCARP
jgi:hypothetical protein